MGPIGSILNKYIHQQDFYQTPSTPLKEDRSKGHDSSLLDRPLKENLLELEQDHAKVWVSESKISFSARLPDCL